MTNAVMQIVQGVDSYSIPFKVCGHCLDCAKRGSIPSKQFYDIEINITMWHAPFINAAGVPVKGSVKAFFAPIPTDFF